MGQKTNILLIILTQSILPIQRLFFTQINTYSIDILNKTFTIVFCL